MISGRSLLVAIAFCAVATMGGGQALGQDKEPSSREAELNRLEAAWTESRNRAQLVSNQIRKLMEQNDMDTETFDLVYEAEREWWLSLHRQYREADLEWKITKARMEHAAKSDVVVDEEVIGIQRELEEVRTEIRRAQAEGVGPGQPLLKELTAQAKSLEEHLAVARRRPVDHLRDEVAELDAIRQVLKAELDEADQKLRQLGNLKTRMDAYRAQYERYTENANRFYVQWERLQTK